MQNRTEPKAELSDVTKYFLISIIPIIAIYCIPYFLVWKDKILLGDMPKVDFVKAFLFILWVSIGQWIHELIHWLFFSIFSSKGFSSVKIGLLWSCLTPYCHCSEPISRNKYIMALIMPLLILGIAPAVTGIITGYLQFLLSGIMLTMGAMGDVAIACRAFREKSNSIIQDHPTQLGYVVAEK